MSPPPAALPPPRIAAALAGHLWTVVPSLLHDALPSRPPAAERWSTMLSDPAVGPIQLTGELRAVDGSDTCVVVVHGLGNQADARYCVAAARAADRAGWSCLRLSLRGADRGGDDLYHAGLTADLDAALASPQLRRYARLLLLGYSLGGHLVLRYALRPAEPRVRAVAAVCAPLDLERSALHIDHSRAFIYRTHVLAGLKAIYRAVAARKPVPTPLAQVQRVRTLRAWDALTVVPRFNFGSTDAYYRSMSVGPRLSQLALPALLVQAVADPMIPPATYLEWLDPKPPKLALAWLPHGGHVGYPDSATLGEHAPPGVEAQALAWLARQ